MLKKLKKLFLTIIFLIVVFFIFKTAQAYFIIRDTFKAETQTPPAETTVVSPIKLIKLSATSTTASIEYNNEGKFISEWKQVGEEIVINGAYFHNDNTPSGFLMINGKRIGKRMFDQKKSGLLVINGDAVIIRDLQFVPIQPGENFDFALQSYPFLIKNSQPALTRDTGKLARRTALGMDKENNLYIIIANDKALSLYEFMNEIIKMGVSFENVLNLDGGPSTGVYAEWGDYKFQDDSYTKVSSILRFKKR